MCRRFGTLTVATLLSVFSFKAYARQVYARGETVRVVARQGIDASLNCFSDSNPHNGTEFVVPFGAELRIVDIDSAGIARILFLRNKSVPLGCSILLNQYLFQTTFSDDLQPLVTSAAN